MTIRSTLARSRRRRLALSIAIACSLAIAGCAYTLISGGRVNQPHADQIVEGIQQLRELRFKQQVPIVLKNPDEVEQMVLEDLKRDFTDEQIAAEGKAGAMLALFPSGIDLKAESVKLLKSQIAG